MITVSDKFRFVATPRTGSRAVTEALMRKYPDAITEYPQNHHIWWEDVPTDLPIYTVIRNPLDQMLSWWAHVDVRNGSERRPLQFAKEYNHPMFLPRDEEYKLNIYYNLYPRYMLYDRTLTHVANTLDLDNIAVVGQSNYLEVDDDEKMELAEYIAKEFTSDVLLYEMYLCPNA